MRKDRWLVVAALMFGLVSGAVPIPAFAQQPAFTLKFGVLAGLTGEPAASGQAWNASAKLAVDAISSTLERLKLPMKVELLDSQDSQGTPQQGVEAAQKLVQIDGVDVIIGDFYSSVTSAAATSVAIPNHVLMFTGGTNPSLTKLNTGQPSIVWQPVAADDAQGRALAQIIADALGAKAKVNVGARNDAYGSSSAAVFKDAWTKQGGTIPQYIVYNQQQPTLDTEAQQLVDGAPDGWLFIDFCQTFQKLAQPLIRTGKWDASKSFGSDTLNDCATRGSKNYPGMRATQANASSGASFPAFKALFAKDAKPGIAFQPFTARPSLEIAAHVVDITNDPGQTYTFEELEGAIKAVMAGQKIHFVGATGPLNFAAGGRVNALAYDIWLHKPDGSAAVIKTISLK